MGNKGYLSIIDKQSSVYDKTRVKDYFLKTSKIFKSIIPKGSSVLEVGSGTGHYVLDLIKNNRFAEGFDYSLKMVQIAKKNARHQKIKAHFFYSDVEKEIKTNKKFDYALLIGNWEYFDKPIIALKNIKKVLNKDGKIIISTLNIFSWPLITLMELTGLKKLKPAFWHFNSIPRRLKNYAKKAGLKVEKSFFNYYFIDKIYILKNEQ